MLFSYEQLKEISAQTLAQRQKFVDNVNAALGVYENAVVAYSDTSAVTITLPDVGQAMGLIYDVAAPNGTTNAVTVADSQGTTVGSSTISVDDGNVTVMSTGREWRVLSETVA